MKLFSPSLPLASTYLIIDASDTAERGLLQQCAVNSLMLGRSQPMESSCNLLQVKLLGVYIVAGHFRRASDCRLLMVFADKNRQYKVFSAFCRYSSPKICRWRIVSQFVVDTEPGSAVENSFPDISFCLQRSWSSPVHTLDWENPFLMVNKKRDAGKFQPNMSCCTSEMTITGWITRSKDSQFASFGAKYVDLQRCFSLAQD